MVNKQVQAIGEMDCICKSLKDSNRCKDKKSLVFYATFMGVCKDLSRRCPSYDGKNIGSNPIAPTNAKIDNKKILYNGKGYY